MARRICRIARFLLNLYATVLTLVKFLNLNWTLVTHKVWPIPMSLAHIRWFVAVQRHNIHLIWSVFLNICDLNCDLCWLSSIAQLNGLFLVLLFALAWSRHRVCQDWLKRLSYVDFDLLFSTFFVWYWCLSLYLCWRLACSLTLFDTLKFSEFLLTDQIIKLLLSLNHRPDCLVRRWLLWLLSEHIPRSLVDHIFDISLWI